MVQNKYTFLVISSDLRFKIALIASSCRLLLKSACLKIVFNFERRYSDVILFELSLGFSFLVFSGSELIFFPTTTVHAISIYRNIYNLIVAISINYNIFFKNNFFTFAQISVVYILLLLLLTFDFDILIVVKQLY